MPTFQCLYLLANPHLGLIEVKRLDVPEDAPTADRFFWLRLDRQSSEISRLDFRSMDSAAEVQERYFEQGFLKFNATTGTYIEKYNSAQHSLDNLGCDNLDQPMRIMIAGFLSQIPQQA